MDIENVIEIEVDTSSESSIPTEIEKVGPAGLSAYEIAVKDGYEGTETEWLASLKGDTGETGATGEPGPQGLPGRDGAIQYTAGDNITIENDVISAEVPDVDLSNYYTKSEVDDGLNLRSFVLKLNDSSGAYSNTLRDADNLAEASRFINELYTYTTTTGKKGVVVKIINTATSWAVFNKSYLWTHENTDFTTQRTQYNFSGIYDSSYMYAFGFSSIKLTPEQVRIYGTWSNNIFTATRIEWNLDGNNYFSPADYPKTNTVLTKTNTTSYTPTANYHPATKKYVDDSIASAITDALGGSY